jgi:hypothetical protein
MKIQKLSDPIKDFVSEMFIILAKLDFRVKFLKWFLANKVNDEDKEEEVHQSINQSLHMIDTINEFISGGQKSKLSILKVISDEKRLEKNLNRAENMLEKNQKIKNEKDKILQLQLEIENFAHEKRD